METVLIYKIFFLLAFVFWWIKRIASIKVSLEKVEGEKFNLWKFITTDGLLVVVSLVFAIAGAFFDAETGLSQEMSYEINLAGIVPAMISGFGLPEFVSGLLQTFGYGNRSRKVIDEKLKNATPSLK